MTWLNKILIGGAAVVALAIILTIAGLWVANARLKSEVAQLQTDKAACRFANDQFAAAVARQNARVMQYQRESALRADRAQEALMAARGEAARFENAAKAWRAKVTKGDACRAAEESVNQYLREGR